MDGGRSLIVKRAALNTDKEKDMSNQPKRKTKCQKALRLRLTKETLDAIDNAITGIPELDINRTGFIRSAILYALDSLRETSQESAAENKEPSDTEITKQINVPETTAEFREHVIAVGETSVPRQIILFALTGGYDKWTVIPLPAHILSFPLEERLTVLPELMNVYVKEHSGQCPFFGTLTGFRYVREYDYYEFDKDGNLVAHVDKPFCQGEVSVSIE
jgi:hypothetical protein